MTSDLNAGLAALAERVRRATVQVYADARGGGSGVIWSADGAVVTNAHVVGAARNVRIELHDGRALHASVTLRDERLDLAELRVESGAAGLTPATIGRAGALRVGDIVAALGAPLGIAGALTVGIVHRAPADRAGLTNRWLEADLRLAPGNSGGPMVDALGRVVGINSMIAGGLALAVPAEAAARFVGTRGARAWLGVTTQPIALRASRRNQPIDTMLALLVVELEAGGPAERAGLLLGDAIVSAGGQHFDWPGALGVALERVEPGAVIGLEAQRGKSVKAIDVVTGTLSARADRAA